MYCVLELNSEKRIQRESYTALPGATNGQAKGKLIGCRGVRTRKRRGKDDYKLALAPSVIL